MSTIEVSRHGERWAVRDSDDSTPIGEYDTRELAELAARDRARELGGAEIVVDEATRDEQLGRVEDAETADDLNAVERAQGLDPGEGGRAPQGGL